MDEHDYNRRERILVVINNLTMLFINRIRSLFQKVVFKRTFPPRRPKLIPSLNNPWLLYSRLKLAVSLSAKYSDEN